MAKYDILKRHKNSPIISPEDIPDCDSVFNCGAVKFKDKYILLLSIIKKKLGLPAMYVAKSEDGVNFKIEDKPLITPSDDPLYKKFDYWICDPRITYLEGTYYIIYPAYGLEYGVMAILGKTDNFKTFQRVEIISLPDNRSPALFSEKINGLYVRIDRPIGVVKDGNLWISYSPDLIYWGKHRPLLLTDNRYWCNHFLETAGPPIETKKGWLLLYHGISGPKTSLEIYYLGAVLLDLDDPAKVIGKSKGPILTPSEPYERVGKVSNVVFSCGAVLEKNGELKVYYGAADTCIGLASVSIDDLIKECLKG